MPPPPLGLLGLPLASSAVWPVSARNTSSSVGRRTRCRRSRRRRAAAPPRRSTPERRRTGTRTSAVLENGRFLAHVGQRADRALDVRRVLEAHLEPLAADAVLELVGGALGDHVAVVDHHDPVGEAVGLLEVLRGQQHGRARRRARLDRLPHAQPRAGVEARGGLVEEQHRRPVDERGGQVEPPAHAAGVGLGGPLGRLGQLEALEQLVRAHPRLLAGHVVELAHHLEVLEAGQVLVHRRVLAREADLRSQRRGVAHDVEARDRARCPRPARSSVVMTLTAVVLPAPLGPSRPRTLPLRAVKSTPQSARTDP